MQMFLVCGVGIRQVLVPGRVVAAPWFDPVNTGPIA